MTDYEKAVALQEYCKTLADLDGCEGGDFLTWLCDLYVQATGGGYAYAEDTDQLIHLAIKGEIRAHLEMIFGDDAESYGYDEPEAARQAVREAARKYDAATDPPSGDA